jgi:hypothetical protein
MRCVGRGRMERASMDSLIRLEMLSKDPKKSTIKCNKLKPAYTLIYVCVDWIQQRVCSPIHSHICIVCLTVLVQIINGIVQPYKAKYNVENSLVLSMYANSASSPVRPQAPL